MLRSTNHALDILGQKLGISGLSFDANGQAAIETEGGLLVFLTEMDGEIEASCQLEGLDYPDEAMMQAMLEANFLGAAVDGSRLALDADKAEVLVCERWRVKEMDAAIIERRFEEFVVLASFWLGEGTNSLLEQADLIRKDNSGDALDTGFGGDSAMIMRL